jgi:hypothetical protein
MALSQPSPDEMSLFTSLCAHGVDVIASQPKQRLVFALAENVAGYKPRMA